MFEWSMDEDGTPFEVINHSSSTVRICHALANFFVEETRKNTNVHSDNLFTVFQDREVTRTSGDAIQSFYMHFSSDTMSVPSVSLS
ncbi:unnamed protein product [Choristocarpus tenellus]